MTSLGVGVSAVGFCETRRVYRGESPEGKSCPLYFDPEPARLSNSIVFKATHSLGKLVDPLKRSQQRAPHERTDAR
jgi:hypothetical protein